MVLSIVICTCDRYDLLPSAIESILKQTHQSFELIVVDNSADCAATEAFGRQYDANDKIRYVHEPVQDLSNARNKGTELARGRIVAFMDDDAVAAPDWAEKLIAAFTAFGSKTGCVGGRILPRWLAPRPDWLGDELLGYLSIVDWGAKRRELKKGEWLAGCNMAFDRETLVAADGFTTNLGRKGSGPMLLSNEEIAVFEKIRSLGKLIVYAPDAVVEHSIGAERLTPNWFLRRAAWQAVSDFIVSPGKAKKNAGLHFLWLQLELKARGAHFFLSKLNEETPLKNKMDRIYYLMQEFLSGSHNLADHKSTSTKARLLKRLFK